jgi:hypothetical protein
LPKNINGRANACVGIEANPGEQRPEFILKRGSNYECQWNAPRAGLLKIVDFPASSTRAGSQQHDIHNLIEKCGSVFVKPIFRGGIGKRQIRPDRACYRSKSALAEKTLVFAEYKVGCGLQIAQRHLRALFCQA